LVTVVRTAVEQAVVQMAVEQAAAATVEAAATVQAVAATVVATAEVEHEDKEDRRGLPPEGKPHCRMFPARSQPG